jgi:hypothetical protein
LTSGDPICQPEYVQAHRFVDGKGWGEESGGVWVELIRQAPMRDESRGVAAHAATLNVSRRVCAAARTRTVAERGCDLERGAGAQRKSWDRGRDVHY